MARTQLLAEGCLSRFLIKTVISTYIYLQLAIQFDKEKPIFEWMLLKYYNYQKQ